MEKSPQQNVVIFLYCGKKNKRFLEDSLTITATDQLKPVLGPPLSQCADKNEACLLPSLVGRKCRAHTHTHTHTHTPTHPPTHPPHLFCFRHWDTVHTYLKLKRRSQVCGIHIIIVIVPGLWVVSALKNIYFMLRLLFAIRMVHQVVTWKTKQNLKVTDPKCHMELTNSYVPSFSKEHLGPLQKFP